MPLPVLLMVCVLLGPASCGPPPSTASGVPPEATTSAGAPAASLTPTQTRISAAREEVTAVLGGLHRVAPPVAHLTETLASTPESVSGRLDLIHNSQRKVHADLAKRMVAILARLDIMEKTQQLERASIREQLHDIQTAVDLTPKLVLGRRCRRDTDCSRVLPDATCGSDGRCRCRGGFRQVSDTVCRELSRLTEWCLEDADCQSLVNNTVCTGDVCKCATRYWDYNNAECRQISAVNVGGSCVGDQDCGSYSQRCDEGTCSCAAVPRQDYEYRLTGGATSREGNVELRRTDGSWGLVCDDDWENTEAQVLCRSLGFRTGDATTESQYGQGGNFHMDNVGCTGSESHLMSCCHRGWDVHDCGSGEVAGARCQR